MGKSSGFGSEENGTTCFCVDFRCLIAITKKDVYPLPRIEDILDTIGQAKYFSTLDLSAGYLQIKLDPGTSEKTAFTTHCGLFEFTRMPFCLCNAPLTFCEVPWFHYFQGRIGSASF